MSRTQDAFKNGEVFNADHANAFRLDIDDLFAAKAQLEGSIAALDLSKVDKDGNKVLSDNNYTSAEKNKLAGIEAGAQVNPDLSSYATKTELDTAVDAVAEDVAELHDSLESLTGSIQYWGEPSAWNADIARRISVEQGENLLTLNNTEATAETTSVKQRYYRLNDGIAFMQSSGLTGDSLKMQLKAGHKYRLLVRYISGTVTSTSGTIDVYVRDENTTNTKGMSPAVVTLLDMADGYSDFVAGSSNINLMIYVSTGILCTNLKVAVYLIDLDASSDMVDLDEVKTELTATAADVQKNKSDLYTLKDELGFVVNPTWEQGRFTTYGYQAEENNQYKRSSKLAPGSYSAKINADYTLSVVRYNSDTSGTPLTKTEADGKYYFKSNCEIILTTHKDNTDISAMTDAEINDLWQLRGTAITDKVDDLTDNLAKITDIVVAEAMWTSGYYIKTNVAVGEPVSASASGQAGMSFSEMKCSEGDIFEVNVEGGNAGRAWCFVDSNRIKLDDAGDVGKTVYRGRIVAPEGAARLIVNDKSGQGTCVKVVGTGLVKEIARGDLLSRHSENLLTFGELTSGYIGIGGAIGTDAIRVTSDFIRVEPGMTYRLRMRVPKSAATNGVFHRCGTYDAEYRFIALTATSVQTPDYEDATYYYVDYRYTFDSNVSYVRVVMRTYGLTITDVASFEAESAPFMPNADAGLRELTHGASAGADMIANSNVASGKYFLAGYGLYLATAAIAAGETIVPGTNCTQTNIAAALNAIAAQ